MSFKWKYEEKIPEVKVPKHRKENEIAIVTTFDKIKDYLLSKKIIYR